MTTSLRATFEVLASSLRGPFARLVSAAIGAELDELGDGMLLDLVVVRLFQNEDLVVAGRTVAVVGAILVGLQLNDPDSFPGAATVLLHDTWLEGDGLREARLHVFAKIVAEGVDQNRSACP